MKGQNPDVVVFDDLSNEIMEQMAQGGRRPAQIPWDQMTRTMAAHPTTKRIVEKVIQESQVPKITDLFPGLKKRRG